MKISVIIGRFQTPYLHKGHLELINEAKKINDKFIVLIGVHGANPTNKNPLSFEARASLFKDYQKDAIILPIHDNICDYNWSRNIDKIIERTGKEGVILGGRNNSIAGYYHGKHEIKIIDELTGYAATDIRNKVAKEVIDCPNFRAGIVYGAINRFPTVYSCCDIAVVDGSNSVLMGKKGKHYNFIGGFLDKEDKSMLDCAKRELLEEAGLELELKYETSIKVEDFRYKGSNDSIMTHFFISKNNERIYPNYDGIIDKEFKDFTYLETKEDNLEFVAPHHRELFELLIKKY